MFQIISRKDFSAEGSMTVHSSQSQTAGNESPIADNDEEEEEEEEAESRVQQTNSTK